MPQNRILLGVIGRPHGVRGQVHVTSHTTDPADLTAYGPLSDDRGRRFTLRWRGDGVAEVAELRAGAAVKVADRTAAEALVNTRLYADRAQLPPPESEEFYYADLIGMAAVDAAGHVLGTVIAVHDYGAGASLEIAKDGAPPVLVPFTRACVPDVDVGAGRVTINLAHDVEADPGQARGEPDGSDRAGRQPRAAPRPDHPQPRRSGALASSASAGEG